MGGKIIVLEGIDGSGKNTQAKALQRFLFAKGIRNELVHFPLYEETFFGREVGHYLNGDFGDLDRIHPKLSAVLYAGDRFEKKVFLQQELDKGTVLILDRYIPSNIAHQAAKLPAEEHQDFGDWVERLEYEVFALPLPDLVILLDMPVEISQSLVMAKDTRSYTAKKQDIHESDVQYLKKVYALYKSLAVKNDWRQVKCFEGGGARSIEAISKEICRTVIDFIAGM